MNGNYNKEMDNCIRSSSLLYARLFEFGERVFLADEGSVTRLSKDWEVSGLLGQEYRGPHKRSLYP